MARQQDGTLAAFGYDCRQLRYQCRLRYSSWRRSILPGLALPYSPPTHHRRIPPNHLRVTHPCRLDHHRPKTYHNHHGHPTRRHLLPSAEFLKDFFQNTILEQRIAAANDEHKDKDVDHEEDVVFDGLHLTASDYTSLHALRAIVRSCLKADRPIRFVNTPREILMVVLPESCAGT